MDETAESVDRRQFARLLLAGVSGTAAGLATTDAAEPAGAEPAPPPLDALLLAQIVAMCPGDHWDEAMLTDVLNDLRGDLARGRQLSAYRLSNSDEMALVFLAPPDGVASHKPTGG